MNIEQEAPRPVSQEALDRSAKAAAYLAGRIEAPITQSLPDMHKLEGDAFQVANGLRGLGRLMADTGGNVSDPSDLADLIYLIADVADRVAERIEKVAGIIRIADEA